MNEGEDRNYKIKSQFNLKQILTSHITQCILQIQQGTFDSVSIQTAFLEFLKDTLQYLLDLKPHKELIDLVFDDPWLIYNSFNNLKILLNTAFTEFPAKKIFSLKGHKFTQQREGFKTNDDQSSDSENEELYFKRNLKMRQSINMPSLSIKEKYQLLSEKQSELAKVIDVKDKKIQELELRLAQREQTITDMTIGYIKDIQHIKEMYLRQTDHPNEDTYEVLYYDINHQLDPEIKTFIEKQISQQSSYYRKKQDEMRTQIKALTQECDQYAKTIQILLQKQDLQQVIRTLFTLEKDGYKIWKGFQDLVGNEYFFKIFENQKGGYGIDYRQIDNFLSTNQSSFRIYQRQREILEEEILVLIERCNKEVNNYKKEIQKQDIQIKSLVNQLETEIIQAKRDTKILLEQKFEKREHQLAQQFMKEKKLLVLTWSSVDHQELVVKNITRYAFFKWTTFAKFLKFYPIYQKYKIQIGLSEEDYTTYSELKSNVIAKLKEQPQRKDVEENEITLLVERVKELKEQLDESQQSYYFLKIENQSLMENHKVLDARIIKYKHDQLMNQQSQLNMKFNLRSMENSLKLIEKPYKVILGKLGFSLDYNTNLLNVKNLNILQGGIDLVQFENKLRGLNYDEIQDINALNNIYLKAQISFNRIINKPILQDQFTITDLCDINTNLTMLEGLMNEERDLFIQNQKGLEQVYKAGSPIIEANHNSDSQSDQSNSSEKSSPPPTTRNNNTKEKKSKPIQIQKQEQLKQVNKNNSAIVSKNSIKGDRRSIISNPINQNPLSPINKKQKQREIPVNQNGSKINSKSSSMKKRSILQLVDKAVQVNFQSIENDELMDSETQQKIQQNTLNTIVLPNNISAYKSHDAVKERSQTIDIVLYENNKGSIRKDMKPKALKYERLTELSTKQYIQKLRNLENTQEDKQLKNLVESFQGAKSPKSNVRNKTQFANELNYKFTTQCHSHNNQISLQPPIAHKINPFQHYQDVFNEKKKIQLPNHTIESKRGIASRVQQQRKERRQNAEAQGRINVAYSSLSPEFLYE